ncbi:MAG: hypothetical protein LAT82_05895 [Nanoarchaeota archaeon]|nr:hypothetical protein [Nanoarchaeota archaeon]
MESLDQLYQTLSSKSSQEIPYLKSLVEKKVKDLSGLVSEEGAIYIVANELGVKLESKPQGAASSSSSQDYMKIEKINQPNVSLNVIAKVLKKYDLVEFTMKSGDKGKIQSVLVGDETGIIRVAFWGDKSELLKEVERDTILDIKNVYVRENTTTSRMELHFSNYSDVVVNPQYVEDIEVKNVRPQSTPKLIEEIELEDRNISIKATIVDIDIPRFYLGCPHTFKKVFVDEGKYISPEHGEVDPIKIPITNVVVNDSSGTMSIVAFRDRAEQLFSKSSEDIVKLAEDLESYREVSKNLVGSMIEVVGNVGENQMTGELQLIVNDVVFVKKSEEEIADMIEEDVKEEKTNESSNQEDLKKELEEDKNKKNGSTASVDSYLDDDLDIEEIDLDDDL